MMKIINVGVEGLYMGNYFKWDPNEHTKMVVEKYMDGNQPKNLLRELIGQCLIWMIDMKMGFMI